MARSQHQRHGVRLVPALLPRHAERLDPAQHGDSAGLAGQRRVQLSGLNRGRHLLAGLNLELGAQVSHGAHNLDESAYLSLGIGVVAGRVGRRVGRRNEGVGAVRLVRQQAREHLPQLLGDERHEGMQQAQNAL